MLYTRSMVNFIVKQIPDNRSEIASSTVVCETQSKTVTEMAILSPDP